MKKIVLGISGGISFLIFLILLFTTNYLSQAQLTQTAASRWSSKKNASQVSCFFSVGSGITEDALIDFEHTVDSALTDASVVQESENPGARLWADAYSADGTVNISSDKASITADAIGIGGDFFLFHPVKLLYGAYFSGNDLMQDYCVIDEDAAWQLFGSNNVAGMTVYIGKIPHIVTGVVERPQGRLAEAAGLESTLVYVSYQTLEELGISHGINHYEIVMPNPVTGFAVNYVREKLGTEEKETEIVENTTRYSLLSRLKLLTQFGLRSMNGKAIIYPYWENIARGYEDILTLLTLFGILFLAYPVGLVLVVFCIWWKHKGWTLRDVRLKVMDQAERWVERRRENRRRKRQGKGRKAKRSEYDDGFGDDEFAENEAGDELEEIEFEDNGIQGAREAKLEDKRRKKQEKDLAKEEKRREKQEKKRAKEELRREKQGDKPVKEARGKQKGEDRRRIVKKNWVKKAVSMGLAFSMVLGLAGCGNGGNKMENAALAKEHVYKLQEFEMPDLGGDDYSIRGSFYRDGIIYMMAQVYHWSEGDDDIDMKMLSMKDDGTDIKLVDMEIPDWRTQSVGGAGAEGGALPGGAARTVPQTETEDGDEEGSEDGSGDGEEGAAGSEDGAEDGSEDGAEGAADNEDGTEPEGGEGAEDDVAVNDTIDDDMLVGGSDVYENSYYGSFCFGGDGMVYGIRNYYYEDYSSEEYTSIQRSYISSWNADGSFAWEKELEGLTSEEEYIYISNMSVTEDGTLHLILNGDNAYKMTVDAQGNVSERTPLPEDLHKIFNNLSSIMNKEDGTFLIIYYDESDWQKQYLVTYDPATDKLGEPGLMPASIAWNGYNTMSAGKVSDLVYSDSRGVFTYTIGQEDSVEKMNFINSDMNISNFNAIIELDENSFIGIFNENYDSEVQAGIFTYVDPKDIQDKAVLVLAGNYIGSDMKQRVVEYNRSNDQYRITVKEYDSYNSYDDYQAGVTQLNNDITSGSMPDILITDGLPVENYVAKGLLADIGKLIEEDEELSQVEFVQNVFDAYSMDGKLHYVIPYFGVSTVVGKKSILGDRTSWTMADMKQLMETLPEGTSMFGEMTRDSFMYTVMNYCGADFIDISTGKCNFDSQDFIDMMEYAMTLPETLEEEDYGEDYWSKYETQYLENRTILRSTYLSNFRNINYSIYGSFGEEVSFVGFPTESGMGAYVQAGESYAISARSANIDGAWEFLRYYLTEEYQKELGWGMPTRKNLFLENAQEATKKPYYEDENGEKVEYDDYYYINGEEVVLDPLTQEQVDNIVNYIYSINKGYYGNTDISNIINEEVASYFSGQKSAQEVAKVIQSRAQIYVDERR